MIMAMSPLHLCTAYPSPRSHLLFCLQGSFTQTYRFLPTVRSAVTYKYTLVAQARVRTQGGEVVWHLAG